MKTKENKWGAYTFDFLVMFIAIISAFALNNWNDNRKAGNTQVNILKEMSNGLEKDIIDININMEGHKHSINACHYWRKLVLNKDVDLDSLQMYFFALTRDYFSLQNVSAYETLKSNGLELIQDDSLRKNIISLYELDYTILYKFEEEYEEMKFFKNYYHEISNIVTPYFIYDSVGNFISFQTPMNLNNNDKSKMLDFLFKMQINRTFVLNSYKDVKSKVEKLNKEIKNELK